MSEQPEQPPYYARTHYRLVSAGFGLLLTGAGAYGLLSAGISDAAQSIGGLILLIPGANMIHAAANAREPWLSKLGPLP